FKFVVDVVTKKKKGWKAKLLSQAVRTMLIKSVVQAEPIYMMSIFKFLIFKFLIRVLSDLNEKSCGGLGIQRFADINDSQIVKLGWLMASKHDNLDTTQHWFIDCQVGRGLGRFCCYVLWLPRNSNVSAHVSAKWALSNVCKGQVPREVTDQTFQEFTQPSSLRSHSAKLFEKSLGQALQEVTRPSSSRSHSTKLFKKSLGQALQEVT
ncbi:hypothetical protein G4B88_017867, partial [Cannabis sativa]